MLKSSADGLGGWMLGVVGLVMNDCLADGEKADTDATDTAAKRVLVLIFILMRIVD
jgi:hypothetical protein